MDRFFRVFGVDVLAKILLGCVTLAIVRYVPAETFALYTFVLAIATVGAQTLSAGFNRIYIVGHDRLGLQTRAAPFLGLELLAVVAVAALALPWLPATPTALSASLALAIGFVLSDFARTRFQQQQQFDRFSAVEFARALLQAAVIAGLLLAWRASVRAEWLIAAQAAALLATGAIALGRGFPWSRILHVPTVTGIVRAIASGPHALLIAYFGVIAVFSQIDIFMLKWLASEQVLAAYGAAARYYALLSLALGAAHAVLLPAIVRAESAGELEDLYARHLQLLSFFAPAVLALVALAPWLLPWIDRGRYPESVPAFQILAVSSIVSFSFSPHVNVLMKIERFGFLLFLVVVATVAALALHAVLIPRYGASGAALATLIASALVTVPIYFATRRLRAQTAE